MTSSSSQDWSPPSKAQDTYHHLAGGAFSTINRDNAAPRVTQSLPKGDKEYQFYGHGTASGIKIGIAMEEFGLEYDYHPINIGKGDQFTSGFIELNPNGKIPAIRYTPKDGKGDSIDVFESGAILLFLAEKYNKFIPPVGTKERIQAYSWVMWQVSAQGPFFGQFAHFYKFAPRDKHAAIDYGVARYSMESRRLLSVMETQLKGRDYFLGSEYTIVDMICFPWIAVFEKLGFADFLGFQEYPSVLAWAKRVGERPAVQRALAVLA